MNPNDQTETKVEAIPKGQTATARLLIAAAMIERYPDHHDQGSWLAKGGVSVDDFVIFEGLERHTSVALRVSPEKFLNDCGTSCCAAGWGVAVTPADVDLPHSWTDAGAEAFGLSFYAADRLFEPGWSTEVIVGVLRALALYSDEDRFNLDGSDITRMINAIEDGAA